MPRDFTPASVPERKRRIAIVTDAWAPQVNGVVRTLAATIAEIEARGHSVLTIAPERYRSVPCPTYPEIRLALAPPGAVDKALAGFAPDAIHIATEGPLGLMARRACLSRGWRFTTAYHTQFPAYVAKRTPLPEGWIWRYMRWFHGPAAKIMAATPSLQRQLAEHGIERTHRWSRGVDLAQFHPDLPMPLEFAGLPRPILLYVGRVAPEKGIEAFLALRYTGTKVVVGDGPALPSLKARHSQVRFLGRREGRALAEAYAGADVFVFPSRTDTFGLVIVEALACGTPVAAFPVPGPADILNDDAGAMSPDLVRAIDAALYCRRVDCAALGARYSWSEATDQFLAGLVDCAAETPAFA